MGRILEFILAVGKHWGALVTGGVIIGVISIWQGTGHSVPASAYWTVALIALFVAFFRVWKDKAKEVEAAMHKLNGAPRLLCKGTSSRTAAIYADELSGSPLTPTGRMVLVGKPTFYHLHIANEPSGITDRKVAEQVAGRVQIFREDGTPAAKERLHRWADAPGPAKAGKQADRLLPLDIPPSGIEYKLDIAMKYDEDHYFYTPNNDTVINGSQDWQEVDFRFLPGTYIAHVHLRGANVATDLKYQIISKGCGWKLEITQLGD